MPTQRRRRASALCEMDQRHVPRGLLSVPLTALLACGYGAGGMPSGAGSEELPEGRGVRLDRDVIVHAAQRVLDEDGLTGLTLRRIGNELGADPTAIYRHFRDKDELLDALAGEAAHEISAPAGASWRDDMTALLRQARDAFAAHPAGVRLHREPSLREAGLAILDRAGLAADEAATTWGALVAFAAGAAAVDAPDDAFERGLELLLERR